MRWPQRNIVKLQFAIERGAADSQHSAGERFVAAGLLENAQDRYALKVGQRRSGKRGVAAFRAIGVLDHGNGRRKIAGVNRVMIAQRNRARDAILQFPHITRPVVRPENFSWR